MGCGGQVEVSREAEVITGAMRPFAPKYDRGEKPPERPVFLGKIFKIDDGGQGSKEDPQAEINKTRNQAQEQDQQVKELPDHIDHDGPCPKVIRILHKATTEPTTKNQPSTKVKLSKDDLPSKILSRWAKLSPQEKEQKRRRWVGKNQTLKYWEIPPYATPPRNDELDVSLEDDYGAEDQEVLDDLEDGEQEEREAMKAKDNIPTNDSDESEDDNGNEEQEATKAKEAQEPIPEH